MHLETKHACDRCEKKFTAKDKLRNHQRFKHERKGIKCGKCSKEFMTNKQLKKHAIKERDDLKHKGKEIHSKPIPTKVESRKIRKGMWIVKLEKMKLSPSSK